MKKSAQIRIILWSVVIVVLLSVLIIGIVLPEKGWRFNIFELNISGYGYKNADEYLVGNFSVEADEIKKLDIEWLGGKVNVIVGDGDEIKVSEEAVNDDDDRLRYRIKDGEISIKFRKSGKRGKVPNKSLTVVIPKDMMLEELDMELISASVKADIPITINEVEIDGVSGSVDVSGLTCSKCNTYLVSGSVTADGIIADEIQLETVSGSIDFTGECRSIEVETVSGSTMIRSAKAPKSIDIETVSGSVRIYMPREKGFELSYSSVSGKVKAYDNTFSKSGNYKDGDLYTEIDVDTVSGNVTISE